MFVSTQEKGAKEQWDKLKCEKAFMRTKEMFGSRIMQTSKSGLPSCYKGTCSSMYTALLDPQWDLLLFNMYLGYSLRD